MLIATSDIIITPTLVVLFNGIFNSGKFQDMWRDGVMLPLCKKGDSNDVNNYRGITLVSSLFKLFTRILNNRLNAWCHDSSIMTDVQYGFREGHGTVDAIFVLYSLECKYISNNKRLYCSFVDFRQAFDSVYRHGVWYKLFKLGVRVKLLNILRSMYDCVKSCIKHNCVRTDFFESNIGLRQGENLWPILFSLFIQDIELILQENVDCGLDLDQISLFLLLFADDLVILSETKDGLQRQLGQLKDYCTKWGLSVNINKTKL